MNLIPFQGLFPKIDLIADLDSFFSNAKYNFRRYVENGFFDKDPSEGMYLYQLESRTTSHYGIIAAIDIMDLLEDKILPHEKTLAAKEQEQLQLTLERKAIIKPILIGFKAFKSFDNFVKEKFKSAPDLEQKLTKKKETHRFWKITNGEEQELLVKMFKKKVPQAYIADGHHRCSISRILWYQSQKKMIPLKMESLLSVLMPFSQMKIYDFNRVVELGEEMDPVVFMARLSDYFNINVLEKDTKPSNKFEITMLMNGSWFQLTWKKSVLKLHKKEKVLLDHFLLNEHILKEILDIKDVREHPGIVYVPGIDKYKGLKKAIRGMDNGVAFMLKALTAEEICYYADNEKTLPPKSSYFLPRVINGMIVQEIK